MPIICEGWWEQEGYGRQSMHRLHLEFQADKNRINFTGSGFDIIGPFLIEQGMIFNAPDRNNNKFVQFIKRYENHDIIYQGIRICQESEVWHGDWCLAKSNESGRWEISLLRTVGGIVKFPIQDIRP